MTEAAGPSWASAGVEPPHGAAGGGADTGGGLWSTPPQWWYDLTPLPGNVNIRIHPSGYLLNILGQKVDVHGRVNRARGQKGATSSRRAGRDGPPEWDRFRWDCNSQWGGSATGGGWGATGGGGGATGSGGGGWGATGGGGGGQAPCTWVGKGSAKGPKGKGDGAKGPDNGGKGS